MLTIMYKSTNILLSLYVCYQYTSEYYQLLPLILDEQINSWGQPGSNPQSFFTTSCNLCTSSFMFSVFVVLQKRQHQKKEAPKSSIRGLTVRVFHSLNIKVCTFQSNFIALNCLKWPVGEGHVPPFFRPWVRGTTRSVQFHH